MARFDDRDEGEPEPNDLTARVDKLPAFQADRRVQLEWSVAGATGAVEFDVRVKSARYNEGKLGSPNVLVSRTKDRSRTVIVKRGQGETLCYQVRAHADGKTSPWSKESCTSIPLDERVLGASGSWQRFKDKNTYDQTYSGSVDKGAELFIGGVFAKRIAVQVVKIDGGGVVAVFVDGKKMKEMNTQSASAVADMIPVATFPSAAKRDIDLRVIKPGERGVYIDALAISLK